MEVGGQRHAPAALPPGKTRYRLYRRLGGSQGRSGRGRKISHQTGIRSPDRPARSESLYRLSYRGPRICDKGRGIMRRLQYFAYRGVTKYVVLDKNCLVSARI